MKGIIIYSKEGYEKNKEFVRRCERGLAAAGCRLSLVLHEPCTPYHEQDSVIKDIPVLAGYDDELPDFAIVRVIDPCLSQQLESLGIKVFNSSLVSSIANDKYRAKKLAQQCGLKTALFLRTDSFPSKESLKSTFSDSDLIIKSLSGHGGSEVYLIERNYLSLDYEKIVCNISKEALSMPYIIEKKILGTARDMRVYIIDSKPVCAVMRSNPNDYRSNFSLGGNVNLTPIPDIVDKMVDTLTSSIYMDYTGIDFIIDENGEYYFNEIEDCAGARMLYSCSDIDIIGMFIAHIVDKVLPKKL